MPVISRIAAFRALTAALALAALCRTTLPAEAKPTRCTSTITNLNFGSFDLTQNTAIDSTATLTVNCSGNSNLAIRVCPNINAGTGGTTTGTPRFMLSGANQLGFDLYQDAARTVIWGSYLWGFSSYTAPTIDITLDGSGAGNATRTIYGRIPAGQQARAPGSYSSSFSGSNVQIAYDQASSGTCAAIGNRNATAAAFTVSATDVPACTVGATNLDFGSAGVLAAAVGGTSSLTATCSATTPYTIGLNGGNAGASNPAQRKLSQGGVQITYGLYRDAAHAQPWGDSVGTNTASGTGSGFGQSLTVYGQVPAQTTPAPGNYSDTIVVTLTY